MSVLPTEQHGIIGNMHTVALVGLDGTIDWWCHPHFDSPSVFAALLDEERGGHFRIRARHEGVTYKQMYLPETNVLITRFLTPDGVGEVVDFMPVGKGAEALGTHTLVRRVSVTRGELRFDLECRPAFNYARDRHRVEIRTGGARFVAPARSLSLHSHVALRDEGGAAVSEFPLREGQTATFILAGPREDGSVPEAPTPGVTEQAYQDTVDYWRRWIGRSHYHGRWLEMVNRSALALKLLTFQPTGAIVAAATTSLPEQLGGERNWDYRYTWIRDASFTLYALMRIGFTEEAHRFMGWLADRIHELRPDGSLQIMYSIEGRHDLTEERLDHLAGYRNSRPVRIGNGAYRQLQLDIYGELMDAVYLFNKYGTPIGYDLWSYLRRLLQWVADHWRQPDEGIWEVRGGAQQFVYSKLMCWVALDRGIRLADKRSLPSDRDRWVKERDAIYEAIMSQGFDPEQNCFVQAFGSRTLDAGALMMPLTFFVSPTDPRMLGTIDAIIRRLSFDSLVHRYDVEASPDGLRGHEGTFSICSFWLVEALTRANRVEEARLLFERMLGYANHVGLYSEEIGPCGEALGNFPQAFTHLGLISAAYNLDRALSSRP
jgi:GH15 family glucan-1,4-alpha-glucosidase